MITTIKLFKESLTKRKADQEIFDYRGTIHELWRPIIMQAQRFQNINFDLENNDTTEEKRTLFINKMLRKDQPVKCEYNIELCIAGGDWEQPVFYFKVELTNQYGLISIDYDTNNPEYVWDLKDKGNYKLFVLIPDNENGNHLNKIDGGFTALTQNDEEIKIDTDANRKLAWKWVENLLTDATNKRWKMLD